jgi:hypothetical protein
MKKLFNLFKRLFKNQPPLESNSKKDLVEVWVDKKKQTLHQFNKERVNRKPNEQIIYDAYPMEHREVLKERVRKHKPSKKVK